MNITRYVCQIHCVINAFEKNNFIGRRIFAAVQTMLIQVVQYLIRKIYLSKKFEHNNVVMIDLHNHQGLCKGYKSLSIYSIYSQQFPLGDCNGSPGALVVSLKALVHSNIVIKSSVIIYSIYIIILMYALLVFVLVLVTFRNARQYHTLIEFQTNM